MNFDVNFADVQHDGEQTAAVRYVTDRSDGEAVRTWLDEFAELLSCCWGRGLGRYPRSRSLVSTAGGPAPGRACSRRSDRGRAVNDSPSLHSTGERQVDRVLTRPDGGNSAGEDE